MRDCFGLVFPSDVQAADGCAACPILPCCARPVVSIFKDPKALKQVQLAHPHDSLQVAHCCYTAFFVERWSVSIMLRRKAVPKKGEIPRSSSFPTGHSGRGAERAGFRCSLTTEGSSR